MPFFFLFLFYSLTRVRVPTLTPQSFFSGKTKKASCSFPPGRLKWLQEKMTVEEKWQPDGETPPLPTWHATQLVDTAAAAAMSESFENWCMLNMEARSVGLKFQFHTVVCTFHICVLLLMTCCFFLNYHNILHMTLISMLSFESICVQILSQISPVVQVVMFSRYWNWLKDEKVLWHYEISESWRVWSFIFQQCNDPKCTAMLSKEWPQNISVNVLEWLSRGPDLRLISRHMERPENGSPSNPMEFERCCRDEWAKDRCSKLVASYSKRLDHVIPAKGAPTNTLAKAVDICDAVFCVEFWGTNSDPLWNESVT